MNPPAEPLLDVRGLQVRIASARGEVRAVDGVDLTVERGEVVGLVGESGCGKTLTALAVMGILPEVARIAGGSILFGGEDLVRIPPRQRASQRGAATAMVFQEPLSALNPVLPISRQIGDLLRRHKIVPRNARRERILELLDHVGIASPAHVADSYPHQLSGGMRQRVMIAMAISCNPALIIADEPTTALDTTVQAQILELLQRLVADQGLAMILISHDLGLVAETCERAYVMYAGRIAEHASVADLFRRPRHPYGSALLRCMPALKADDSPLETIDGILPDLVNPPKACRFAERCRFVEERCRTLEPPVQVFGAYQSALCWRADELRLPGAAA